MPKIIAFDPVYNKKLSLIVNSFAKGCNAKVVPLGEYEECDIAIVFGLYKKSFPPTFPKLEIMKRHTGKRLLVIESAFVKRGEYWQVGWGGQAGNADFNVKDPPLDRWESFGINVEDWKIQPNGVYFVCGQLPRDTTVQDTDHALWCRQTLQQLKDMGKRAIFRPHPRARYDLECYGIPFGDMRIEKLPRALSVAKCFVTYNSTSGVDAAIAGVPVIAFDKGSFAYEIASHSLEEPLVTPDRTRWLAKLGYAQWSLPEMSSGKAWAHISNGVW